MTSSAWNPAQYNRFRTERQQPFFDLLALVRRDPAMRVVDLGCGTGELTAILHRELAARETVGIDRSETMLADSRAFTTPGLRFECADIGDYGGAGPFDLVFSNAALQWIDGHAALFRDVTALLGEHGQLAVQMPANYDHPSHIVAAEVAGEAPFREALGGFVQQSAVWPPEAYATLLDGLGYGEQHVRVQVYAHRLQTRDDVIEWVKGTLLTAYQRRLPADVFSAFLERYRTRLLPRLADTQPFFYPFKRLLLWARR